MGADPVNGHDTRIDSVCDSCAGSVGKGPVLDHALGIAVRRGGFA